MILDFTITSISFSISTPSTVTFTVTVVFPGTKPFIVALSLLVSPTKSISSAFSAQVYSLLSASAGLTFAVNSFSSPTYMITPSAVTSYSGFSDGLPESPDGITTFTS